MCGEEGARIWCSDDCIRADWGFCRVYLTFASRPERSLFFLVVVTVRNALRAALFLILWEGLGRGVYGGSGVEGINCAEVGIINAEEYFDSNEILEGSRYCESWGGLDGRSKEEAYLLRDLQYNDVQGPRKKKCTFLAVCKTTMLIGNGFLFTRAYSCLSGSQVRQDMNVQPCHPTARSSFPSSTPLCVAVDHRLVSKLPLFGIRGWKQPAPSVVVT